MSDINPRIFTAITAALKPLIHNVGAAMIERATDAVSSGVELSDAQLEEQASTLIKQHCGSGFDQLEVAQIRPEHVLVEPVMFQDSCALVMTARPVNTEQCFQVVAQMESDIEPGMPVPDGYIHPEPRVLMIKINYQDQTKNAFIQYDNPVVREELKRQLCVMRDHGARQVMCYVTYLRTPEVKPEQIDGSTN